MIITTSIYYGGAHIEILALVVKSYPDLYNVSENHRTISFKYVCISVNIHIYTRRFS